MLKSSPALDGFHSILKMKRRVAGGGGGWVVCAEVEGGDMREMREPFGKKEEGGKTKRENHGNTSSTLQHRHNTRIYNSFLGRKRVGMVRERRREGG